MSAGAVSRPSIVVTSPVAASKYTKYPPPPMPELYGSVTPSAAAVAIAASTALPPSRSTSRPIALADASTDETAPPYPVEVDGAGGVGRPAATPVTAVDMECADAGAAVATSPTVTTAASVMVALLSAGRRRTTLTMMTPELVTSCRIPLTVDPYLDPAATGCADDRPPTDGRPT